MCELLAISSNHPTQLTFSLHTLAAHSAQGASSRDGWGAAFYDGHDIALFREPVAAHDSPLVQFLQQHGPPTTLAISHIRHATQGAVALQNTQPYSRELAGRMHTFAHNGNLRGIEAESAFAVVRCHPVGDTDSELAFCALMERMQPLWRNGSSPPPLGQRLAVVAEFAADLSRLGPANFLYADGEFLFAHGHRRIQPGTGRIEAPGLWILSRRCAMASLPLHVSGISVAAGFQQLLLVASVPLSDEPWQPLTEGQLLAIALGEVVPVS